MSKLRVGIIGCGGIANSKHMSALKKIEEVEMVAFCDIILEKAEKAVKEYGTPDAKAYEDYNELLKDESIVANKNFRKRMQNANFHSCRIGKDLHSFDRFYILR